MVLVCKPGVRWRGAPGFLMVKYVKDVANVSLKTNYFFGLRSGSTGHAAIR